MIWVNPPPHLRSVISFKGDKTVFFLKNYGLDQ